MSFTQNTLSKSSTGYAHKVSGQQWIYSSTTDDLATIKTDGYFDQATSLFTVGETFSVVDVNFEADLLEIFEINLTSPKVKTREFVGTGTIPDGAVTNPKLASDAVTNVKILNDTITFRKLEPQIQPVLNPILKTQVITNDMVVEQFDIGTVTNVFDSDFSVVTMLVQDPGVIAPGPQILEAKIVPDTPRHLLEVKFTLAPNFATVLQVIVFRPVF